ncbi:hypothetical protein L2744_19625, partial [Shewanella profunda]|uniref:hypothetical protein n=1 Tax=Shewanella profunda TaxID=254793 RepID=UPI00200DA784
NLSTTLSVERFQLARADFSSTQGCVFYAFPVSRQGVFANFLFAHQSVNSSMNCHIRLLSLSAVSVDAHYREQEILRKRFLKEKRSHGDLLNNADSFSNRSMIN